MMRTWFALVFVAAGGSAARAECPEEPPQMIEVRVEPALFETMSTVYFARGSARIRGAARDEIRAAADWLSEHPRRLLIIEGHADSSGSWQENMQMSQDRAASVRDALVEAGADPVRLVSSSHSEDEAVFDDPACNRRVVLRGAVQPFEELVESQRDTAPERDRVARPAPTNDRAARPAPRQP